MHFGKGGPLLNIHPVEGKTLVGPRCGFVSLRPPAARSTDAEPARCCAASAEAGEGGPRTNPSFSPIFIACLRHAAGDVVRGR